MADQIKIHTISGINVSVANALPSPIPRPSIKYKGELKLFSNTIIANSFNITGKKLKCEIFMLKAKVAIRIKIITKVSKSRTQNRQEQSQRDERC